MYSKKMQEKSTMKLMELNIISKNCYSIEKLHTMATQSQSEDTLVI